jgi:hypothetical protein
MQTSPSPFLKLRPPHTAGQPREERAPRAFAVRTARLFGGRPAAGMACLLCLMLGLGVAGAHKFRVDDPQVARALLAQGNQLIADYGSFQIFQSTNPASASAGEEHVQLEDRLDRLQLVGASLDTSAPATRSLRPAVGGFEGRRLHLVQFAGPIKPEWRQALEATGVAVISYLPQDAYLVCGDAGALGRLQSWAAGETAVQWEGAYLAGYKIHPRLHPLQLGARQQPAGSIPVAIQLISDSDGNAATLGLIDEWKVAPVRKDSRVLRYRNIVVSLPSDRLNEIASQPDVVSILPWSEPARKDERQDQIIAGNLSNNSPSGPGDLAWLAAKGFTQAQFAASGFVVDVSDSGIDNGTTQPGHFSLYPLADVSQNSRVAYCRLEGFPNPGSTLQGCDGHGTLNAQIIAGYDRLTGFPHTDPEGFSYGLGVCPFVRVGSSVVFDPDQWTGPDYPTLQTQAYNSGARISNNSWGSSAAGAYDSDAQTFDALVRDVGGGVAGRQMVIVFVAGNEGPTGDTPAGIDSPGTAKNVITVGACESVRSLSPAEGGNDNAGRDACATPDSEANSANDVEGFSSQGPCADGRMKPDLVAPGTHITGGAPQDGAATTNGTGSGLACFNASGVCALPGSGNLNDADNFFPLGQQFFTVSSGTSHSGPAVAGACALLRQYFINHGLSAPSPAMTKACLMNAARYLTGAYANDSLWSPAQGMGALDLDTMFDGVPRILRDQLSGDTFTASGQTRTLQGVVADPSKPLRVTLAWTDAAGSTAAARALVNDLDLTLDSGSKTYRGNVFNGAVSIAGGKADSLNNVESIFLPAGQAASFTVTITAANIAGDALMNGASSPRQDFALVVYNAILTNAPPYIPTAAEYDGLFYQASGPVANSSGSISVKTTAKGGYSAALRLGIKRYSFRGSFDTAGAATAVVNRKNDSPLTVALRVDTTDYSRVTGTVTAPDWVAELLARRMPFNARNNAAPYAGTYTLVVPGNADPGNTISPQGDGYCSLTVNASGLVKFAGALADSSRFSGAAAVAADGQWPFYVPLYHGQGCILGWLGFAETQSTDLAGVVTWLKQPDFNSQDHPSGFDVQTNASGSAYQRPSTPAAPVLNFTAGQVILSGGGLATPITNAFTIGPRNKISSDGPDHLSCSLVLSKGLFKGSVVEPGGRKRLSFSGALLQKQDSGSGFFLGDTTGGRVSFGP